MWYAPPTFLRMLTICITTSTPASYGKLSTALELHHLTNDAAVSPAPVSSPLKLDYCLRSRVHLPRGSRGHVAASPRSPQQGRAGSISLFDGFESNTFVEQGFFACPMEIHQRDIKCRIYETGDPGVFNLHNQLVIVMYPLLFRKLTLPAKVDFSAFILVRSYEKLRIKASFSPCFPLFSHSWI